MQTCLRKERRQEATAARAATHLSGVVESVVGVRVDAIEDIAEIGEGIDAEMFAGCDEAGQHGSGVPAVVAAIEHPVLPIMRSSA